MRKHLVAVGAALLAGIAGCTASSDADQNGHGQPTDTAPSIADFVGRTKKDARDALTGTGTVFGFRDTRSNLLSVTGYDSWIVCKQDAGKEAIWFTVAADRRACGLSETSPSKEKTSPAPSSPVPEATDTTVDRDSRYATAVKE
ncbi:hypothetical protein ACIQMP_23100 [Streptomyces sp. NPDC091385]|uniref:hypothetical protein n=1 Tax=Streptomyces sp. NPDC091385 TaxID=3365997 RepID=UPI00381F6788